MARARSARHCHSCPCQSLPLNRLTASTRKIYPFIVLLYLWKTTDCLDQSAFFTIFLHVRSLNRFLRKFGSAATQSIFAATPEKLSELPATFHKNPDLSFLKCDVESDVGKNQCPSGGRCPAFDRLTRFPYEWSGCPWLSPS